MDSKSLLSAKDGDKVHIDASPGTWWGRRARNRARAGMRELVSRYTLHLAIVCLVATVLFAGGMQFPFSRVEPTPTAAPQLGARTALAVSYRGATVKAQPSTFLMREPVPHTTIPERLRRGIITYTVQPGDYIEKIAADFGIHWKTIMWSNEHLEDNPHLLLPDQILNIPPIDGAYHTIEEDDTIPSIAEHYEVTPEDIYTCEYNDIQSDVPLMVGTKLLIPGGIKPYIPLPFRPAFTGPIPAGALRGTGGFVWPAEGRITDRFGYSDWRKRWHQGLDIANSTGTPIYAADAGYVRQSGWTQMGLGTVVIIDHGNGYWSYYGHCSAVWVRAGQSVSQGQLIAYIGNTGRSLGSHLHFEVRLNGKPIDPEPLLP